MSSGFVPSPQEITLTNQIFEKYGAQQLDKITEANAVEFFRSSGLTDQVLQTVWGIAHNGDNGFLTRNGVQIALRLIGHAQRGERVTDELLSKGGLPPSIKCLLPLPLLTSQDKTKFMKIFHASNPVNGRLSGDKASETFLKSKLPIEKLSPIWNLADTQHRGSLDATDFCIAMYLIQAIMSGQLSFVPNSLPPGLYDQASGKFDTVITPFPAPPEWDITPQEFANSNKFFDNLDTAQQGYIEADAAVPFMNQSNLPEDALAQIWELSDLNKDGRLTSEAFAVAFHLIQSKLVGKDIPKTLPLSLVPPSLRVAQSTQDIQDLLWDDPPPPSTTTITQPVQPLLQPQRTGTLNATPLQPHLTGFYQPPIQPQRTGPQLTQSPPVFPQSTGGATQFTSTAPVADSFTRDFLSDDEPSVPAPPLEDKSAEIGNLYNQLNSTNRSLNTVQNERADIEQRLAEQATELSNLQTQLTAAKAAYETETKLLVTLRERYANQNTDINKTRQELITAESDVSALRLEKNEVQNTLLRDKEEVRELQKKMAAAGAEIETIKTEIEKAKKDAKQQKGLLAIAKKQLAAREAEKGKVETERREAEAELVETTNEKDEAETELVREPDTTIQVPVTGHDIDKPSSADILVAAISQPLPDTPGGSAFGSPSLRSSSVTSTNPFEHLTTTSPPPSRSPFVPFSASAELPVSIQPKDDNNLEVDLDDPFGLGAPHTKVPQPIIGVTELSVVKDRATSPSSVAEADDLFVTPPASALPMHESPKGPEGPFSPLNAAASKFPLIPGAFSEEPDSLIPAKEDTAEEDSSDDEDGPEEVTPALKQQPLGTPAPAHAEVTKQSSTGSSFDDVFGVNSETSASIISMPSTVTPNQTGNEPSKSPFQPFLSTATNPLSTSTSSEKPVDQLNGTIAGKNAFDEAIGVIPSGQTTTSATLGFNPAFDDDFDFVAAKADSNAPPFPTPYPVPTPSQSPPTTNGGFNPFPPAPTSAGTPFHANVGFDNAFGVDDFSPAPAPGPPTIQEPGPGKEQTKPFSFVTAFETVDAGKPEVTGTETKESALHPNLGRGPLFGGDRTSKNIALFNAFGSGSIPQLSSNPSSPVQPVQFPRPLSPSPQGTSTPPPGSNGSIHSHHEQSSSKLTPPKPRPTTGDKLKEKEHQTRTSRLSIRLPFGRKKKSQDAHTPPPIPARGSHLTPPQEHNFTESEDADVVKQLMVMGFSREDAVVALERSSYDFQRALNSLVGSG